MIPFAMIMGDELSHRPSEMPLAQRNQPIETFFFDRPDKPFGMGVRIRCSIRRPDDPDSRILQAGANRLTPFRVPIADEERETCHCRPS